MWLHVLIPVYNVKQRLGLATDQLADAVISHANCVPGPEDNHDTHTLHELVKLT